MRTLLPILFNLCFFTHSLAQDVHYSNIHSSPLNNNPAWTGVFEDEFRVIANYRNQWKSPTSNFNTFSVSVDGKYIVPSSRLSINAGFQFTSDRAGDLNFGTNNYNFVSGITLPMNRRKSHFLTTGVQLGMIDHTIDISKVRAFDDEPLFDGLALAKRGLDISVGAGYYWMKSANQTLYAGVALFHVNQQNVSISESASSELFTRYVFNAGSTLEFKKGLGLQPSIILYWQGPHREITIGSYSSLPLKLNGDHLKDEVKVYLGLWTRYYINSQYKSGFDAAIISTRVDIGSVSLLASIDITLSRLLNAGGFITSPEISMVYTFSTRQSKYDDSGILKSKRKIKCPKF